MFVLPITITPELTHLQLSQNFARLVKNRTIWVYDNGVLIKGSPFYTQTSAAEAIGLPKNTSVIKRYIDTDKLYVNRYAFYSTRRPAGPPATATPPEAGGNIRESIANR